MNYQIKTEEREVNGMTYTDVVCYFGEKRFVLVPLGTSKKMRSLFYAYLKGKVKA